MKRTTLESTEDAARAARAIRETATQMELTAAGLRGTLEHAANLIVGAVDRFGEAVDRIPASQTKPVEVPEESGVPLLTRVNPFDEWVVGRPDLACGPVPSAESGRDTTVWFARLVGLPNELFSTGIGRHAALGACYHSWIRAGYPDAAK